MSQPVIKREYFYCARGLDDGRELQHQADTVCESASTIKVPILAALLKDVEAGRSSLRQPMHIKKEHYSHNGSGILQNFYRTQPFSLYNLALMMITISDNVATNAIIDHLGKSRINDYIKSLGLNKTKLIMSQLTFPDDYGVNDERIGETTPREMANFLEWLLMGELLSPAHTKIAEKFLSLTQSSLFGRKLPTKKNSRDGVRILKFGNKTGACYYEKEYQQVLNDCGFFKANNKTYIFSVFSSGQANRRMQYATDSFPRMDFANQSKKIYQELVK